MNLLLISLWWIAEEKTYKFLTGFKRTNTSTLDEERARKRQRR